MTEPPIGLASGAPAPDGDAQARSGRPFVGRVRELVEATRALDHALGGVGQLVLLAGEPGIGKTRLCDEISAVAATKGALVAWGRCWEAGGAPAYWPWSDVLAALARTLDDAVAREALGEGAALVGELLPELRASLGEAPAATSLAPPEARFALWRSVTALIRRAASPAGLLIVLDDLHAADEASLALLQFVAREVRSLRALVVGTYRDAEARFSPGASDLLGKIGRDGTTLSLARLDPPAASALIRQFAGEVRSDVEAKIVASTQGNPLFVEEMLRLLDEEGPDAITGGRLPHGVRDVIRQRLERVPADARPLLDLAAVAGDELDVAAITEAARAGGDPPATASARLAAAVRAGVLFPRGDGRLRFSHALVREILYRHIDPERRLVLHGRIAEALELLHAGRPTLPLSEIAHHALAGPAATLGRAVELAVQAAARALDMFAYEEAIALLERAAQAVDSGGGGAAERAHVLLARADAHIRKGDHAAGKAFCLEAAALARGLGQPELVAKAALVYGQIITPAVVDPILVDLLEEALALLPAGDTAVRVRLMARLGGALQPMQDVWEPVRVAREAVASARRLRDPATLLEALHAGMSAMMDVVVPPSAWRSTSKPSAWRRRTAIATGSCAPGPASSWITWRSASSPPRTHASTTSRPSPRRRARRRICGACRSCDRCAR